MVNGKHRTLHSGIYTLHTAHYTMHNIHCILYNEHSTFYTVKYTLHTIAPQDYATAARSGKIGFPGFVSLSKVYRN